MTRSQSINSYQDIKKQLEEIRLMDGAEIDFGSFGAAVSWVARVYTYRALLRKQAKVGMPDGVDPSTPWDDIILRHDKAHRSTSVQVEFGILTKGTIKPLSKHQRSYQTTNELPVTPIMQDDLLAAAMQEVKDKGNDDGKA